MLISVKSTVNFGKMKSRLPKLITGLTNRAAKDSVRLSKESVSRGSFEPISEVTKKIRKLRGRGGRKPLIDTGAFLKSIKAKDNIMSFLEHGKDQLEARVVNKNFKVGDEWFIFINRKVPERYWLKRGYTDKNIKKFIESFRASRKA